MKTEFQILLAKAGVDAKGSNAMGQTPLVNGASLRYK